MTKQTPFWILTLAAFIGLVAPATFQDGMFMDGALYATVSRNLAVGKGSFWFPYFSETFLPQFNEQLPLFFAIQSNFFKILGNTLYAERICCMLFACLTAFLILITWREFFKNNDKLKQLAWLPILLWVATPVVFWAYANNVQETMMSALAVASVYFSIKALNAIKNHWLYLILAGLFIFLCSFCKGLQGLFPLVAIGAYWLSSSQMSFTKTTYYSLILLAVPAIIYGLLLLNEDAVASFKANFHSRLVNTFNMEQRATTDNHFHLLSTLLQELIPALGLALLVVAIYVLRIGKLKEKLQLKPAIFFILIGISGSFPLMVTLEQRNFYLVTSVPFYTLGIAAFAAPYLYVLVDRVNTKSLAFKAFGIFSGIGVITAVIITIWLTGTPKRDAEVLHDVYAIGNKIGHNHTISAPASHNQFSTRMYFMRYYHVSMDIGSYRHTYHIQTKETSEAGLEDYSKVEIDLKKYNLYTKKQ